MTSWTVTRRTLRQRSRCLTLRARTSAWQLSAPDAVLPLLPPSHAPRRSPDPSSDEQAAVMGEHRCPPPASAAAPSTLPGARLNARCNAPGLFLATTLGALLLVAWRGRVWQPPTAASCQVASASRPARGHIRAASGGAARTGCATGRGVGGRLRRLCQQRFLLPHRLPRQPGAPCPLAAAAQRRPAGCSRPRGDTPRAGLGAAGRGGRPRARAERGAGGRRAAGRLAAGGDAAAPATRGTPAARQRTTQPDNALAPVLGCCSSRA